MRGYFESVFWLAILMGVACASDGDLLGVAMFGAFAVSARYFRLAWDAMPDEPHV